MFEIYRELALLPKGSYLGAEKAEDRQPCSRHHVDRALAGEERRGLLIYTVQSSTDGTLRQDIDIDLL